MTWNRPLEICKLDNFSCMEPNTFYWNICFFYCRADLCIVDCVQKKDLTDFEPFMEKFVELDLARFVHIKEEHVNMMFDLCEKGNLNLLKPLVQASKDKIL